MLTALLSFVVAASALAPLTDAQRAQLQTAMDRSPVLDEGALYPLLHNALTWTADDGAGASPDYDDLLLHPGEHRGELFLIEGQFARSRRFGLSRAGPWGDALTEWVLLVREEPEEVAVVYFVDPQGELVTPRVGQAVRTSARFYKLWGDRDMRGDPATYLTFVGRSAIAVAADAAAGQGGDEGGDEGGDAAAPPRLLVLGPMLGAALAAYLLFRFILRPKIVRTRHADLPRTADRRRTRPAADLPDGPVAAPSQDAGALPSDPAEALDELHRRQA